MIYYRVIYSDKIRFKQKYLCRMLNYGKFITPAGLKNIENYKYTSSDYTFFDNLLNPFWTWAASFVPLVIRSFVVFNLKCSLWPRTWSL